MTSEYPAISDDMLDQLVLHIKQNFPTCGNKQISGHLVSRGYTVQQVQVREATRRVNHKEGAMR